MNNAEGRELGKLFDLISLKESNKLMCQDGLWAWWLFAFPATLAQGPPERLHQRRPQQQEVTAGTVPDLAAASLRTETGPLLCADGKPCAFPLVRLWLEIQVHLRLQWRQNSVWLSSGCKIRGKSSSSPEVIALVKPLPNLPWLSHTTCPCSVLLA